MQQPAATRPLDVGDVTVPASRLYLSFELGNTEWKLGFTTGFGQQPRERTVAARDLKALETEITAARKRFKLPADARVLSCYEAGRDGFWLHRVLAQRAVENLVVDSASIEVNRRARRAKFPGCGSAPARETLAGRRSRCGTIQPEAAEPLRTLGEWLRTYGAAVYGTRGGPIRPRPWGVTTQRGDSVFVHVLDWPDRLLTLPDFGARVVRAFMLRNGAPVAVAQSESGITLTLPAPVPDEPDRVILLETRARAEAR